MIDISTSLDAIFLIINFNVNTTHCCWHTIYARNNYLENNWCIWKLRIHSDFRQNNYLVHKQK